MKTITYEEKEFLDKLPSFDEQEFYSHLIDVNDEGYVVSDGYFNKLSSLIDDMTEPTNIVLSYYGTVEDKDYTDIMDDEDEYEFF